MIEGPILILRYQSGPVGTRDAIGSKYGFSE
jgi:hypothetical protein